MSVRFSPPTAKQRAKALGDIYRLNGDIRRAVTAGIDECFPSIPVPHVDDWLNIHEESGQTVQEFEKILNINKISTCRTIYIQPIGSFEHTRLPSLDVICEFSRYFFLDCKFEILPEIDFNEIFKHHQNGNRINSYTQKRQYLTTKIISYLKKLKHQRKKDDHDDCQELFCIGVTAEDIYSDPDDNFVYGCASTQDGIGIYSFARLDPLFPDIPFDKLCSDEERTLILKRAISIFVHEIFHLFGLTHCIYYLCLMNGAEHEEEMDKQPLYLCPICLTKIYLLFGKEKKHFNIEDMYMKILDLCKKFHFQEEVQWYANRLKLIFNHEK